MSQKEDQPTPKLRRVDAISDNATAKKILTDELCDTDTEEEMGNLVEQLIDEQEEQGKENTKKPNK